MAHRPRGGPCAAGDVKGGTCALTTLLSRPPHTFSPLLSRASRQPPTARGTGPPWSPCRLHPGPGPQAMGVRAPDPPGGPVGCHLVLWQLCEHVYLADVLTLPVAVAAPGGGALFPHVTSPRGPWVVREGPEEGVAVRL